jgi:hypothetical protein
VSTPNINCILQALAVVTDQNTTNFPQIASFDFQNPTLPSAATGGTGVYWEPYFQATVGGVVVPLPAAKIFGLLIKNLSATSNLTVQYTPAAGLPAPVTVGPGGVFIYFDPSEAGQGITAATLFGVGGTVSASVLVVV